MGTNINQRDLDDPLFEPILARIEALHLPIFLTLYRSLAGSAPHLSRYQTYLAFLSILPSLSATLFSVAYSTVIRSFNSAFRMAAVSY